jgi:hypothetical protein
MSCNGRRVVTGWMTRGAVISVFVFLCACSLVRNVCAEANFLTSIVSGLTNAYHIVSTDFNNDTIPDLAVTNWSVNQVTILLGNGLGGFTIAATLTTGVHPNFIATGNLNGSGGIDMAVTNGGGQRDVTLFFNDGTGASWTTSTLSLGNDADVSSVVAANFTSNIDSNIDLFIVKYSVYVPFDYFEVWQGDGAGAFTGPGSGDTGDMPIFAATADFNGDTIPDVVVVNFAGNSITVLLGNGNGSFSEALGSPIAVGTQPRAIAAGNLNSDGYVDLAIVNYGSNSVTILLGNGDGTFTNGGSINSSGGTHAPAIGDFDGDGFNDIAVTRLNANAVSIYYGNGDGTFKTVSTDVPVGTNPLFIVAADLDNDGKADLAVTNYGSNNVTILLNKTGVCLSPLIDMVSWWSADGHSFDLYGIYSGTMMNGTTYASGRVGRAFSFDGVDDFVEVDLSFDDIGNTPFTIDFWMFSRSDGNNTYVLGKSHPDGGFGWDMRLSNNSIQVYGVNGWDLNITSDTSVTRDAWHHVALASTDTTVTLYVDGVLKGTSPRSAISSTTNPGRIGYTTNFGGSAFFGLIDEVGIFNRALTSQEIVAIYNTGGVGQCKPCLTPPSGLVSWWTGDGNANDIIGVNDGTMMNGATFAAGRVGQAFSFDGNNDFVRVLGPVSIPEGNDSRTIGAWIKSTGQTGGNLYQGVVGYGTTNSGEAFYLERGGNTSGPDDNKLYYMNLATGGRGTTDLVMGEWYHVDYTYDGNTSRLYVNGQLEATVSDPTLNTIMNAEGLTIGTVPALDGWHANFNGLIDEPMVFNRALTAEEIAAVFAAGSAGMCVPPDTTPEQFYFDDQIDVALNTLIPSNIITVAGINAPSPISVAGGEYSINGGDYTSTASTVNNGQNIRVRQTSSSSYSTTTNATLTIGSVSDTFSVITIAPPQYTINYSSAGHGTIVCYPATVVLGNNSVCTITPDTGYLLENLTDNGTDVISAVSGNTYTIVNVTAAHTVEATFARFTFTPERGTLGTVIEMSGPAFGVKKGKIYFEKDGVRYATKVSEWNLGGTSNLIKATVKKAPPAGSYRVILISKEVGEISAQDTFEIMVPEVNSASVAMVDGKKVATILGDYFGYTKKPKVYMNDGIKDLSCKVISTKGTEIRCYPHKSIDTGTYTVKVIVGKILLGERVLVITIP